MQYRHRSAFMLSFSVVMLLFAIIMSSCGSSTSSTGSSTPIASTPTDVSINLGYIPDIQFAPFYVAESKGYYKAAGLNVTFHNTNVDFVSLVSGNDTFVFAGGDELLVARSKNLPVVDVASIYQKYPVSLIVPANSAIHTLADLKGHSIGIPGRYGSTYTGLQALLYQAHLTLSDVNVQVIGYTQVAALIGKQVDAVMGYSNNEPLQLTKKGFAVKTFAVSDYQPLVSNGILTTQDIQHNQPQLVKNFVQATLKGLQETISNPTEAVQISKTYVQSLQDINQATDVLQATIPLWQGNRLGYNDSTTWQSMTQFLVAEQIIPPVTNLSQAYNNDSLA